MSVRYPEIYLANPVVGLDLNRRPSGKNLAAVENRYAIRDRKHDLHVMFDHQDRKTPWQVGDEIDHLAGFGGRHARGRFIEQQELGLGGKCNTEPSFPPLAAGKVHEQTQPPIEM